MDKRYDVIIIIGSGAGALWPDNSRLRELYADGNQSLLVVFQALDAAGKGGVIGHVFSGMNPQGTFLCGFKQPSKDEAAHDFLWRAHLRTPARAKS